jgi:SOS-response transcriptional repressor LexA
MNKLSKVGEIAREKIMQYLLSREVTISPVSIDELTDAAGCSSTSVTAYHLSVLEKQGKIIREKNKARHIEVVKK